MKISFNPSNSNKNILDLIKNNKDIIFDLKGHSIFARGVEFKGTDTNTWRDIKINNVSIGSHTLDLRNGSNTTLTNTNGVVTINSTWRPVVDNLTSDSTTSSLSAKQGKVLKALIDGKSDSDHNHDGRYLKLTGGTMASNALITFADSGSWDTSKKPQGARGGLYWTGQSDYAKLYAEETVEDNLDLVIQFGDDNSNGLSIRNKANTQTSYISAGGVITTGTFKGNLDWSYITNKPASYTPSAHTHAWNSLTHSSTTENQAILTNGKANGWKLYTLNISRWDNAANNAHSHANKSALDGITSALVNSWNTAYNFVSNITGTDTDKVINKWEEIVNFLAGITEDNKLNTLLNSKLSIQQLSAKDILTTKTNNALFWVDTKGNASTITTGPFTDHPYALLSVTNYNQNAENHKFFYRSRLAFSSAGDIKVASCHHEYEYQQDETWYNVLTSKNSGINGSTIKLNGTSITVYSSGTADGRYVKKSGDTMQGVLTIDTTNFGALTIKGNDDAYGASIQFRGKSSVYGYIGLNNSTKDKQFLRWSSDISRIYTILDTSSTYISNGKGVINGTTITQVDNATNSTNSTNARKLVNWYSARPTSLNAQFGDGSLRIFYATSSTTEGKPAEDSHILHLAWDNTGEYDAQLAVHVRSGKVSTRAQNGGTWQPWKTLAFITDIPTSLKNPYSFNVFGVVYDGSAAKTVTTSNFISQVNEGTSTITDGTMLITSYASNSGFADTNAVNVPYKRKAIHLWEYIKAKTDSLYATKGHTHDDRYYTESEVNSLLDAKLNRQNLSYGTWNPRGYHLAADYNYNGGDLSISENNGKMYVSVNGCFWQNEGQYRVLDTSDIGDIRGSVTLHQYLGATDVAWYPLIWGGNSHNNTSDSTGAVYKSYDKLSWQTSSQTLYATNIQTNNIKNLSIGGGIYWNPNVESATDDSDIASITLVRSGVAGGTTLVLSQMNDTNDTIQFKTNNAARLYHNSYPILTTQNTYVSNNKGYINGLEITQVNNADTVDGQHASAFSYKSWWHWYGKEGQPNWLWGGNNENDYYVYNPSNFRVAYAASAGNADTLDGYPANGSNDRPYGHIPTIESDGVMEVGRYIDFHNDNNGKHDFSTRLQSTGNYGNEVNLPSASGTLALINDVNNYYWANVKISTSSSTTTSPTFSNVYLGNSLYLNTRGPNSIYNGPNDSANSVGCPLNNLVFSSWYGVSFTTSCAGQTYTNKNAVSINCRTGQLYAGEVEANGFMHTDHNNNDAVLLAGGGYKTLKDFMFFDKANNYTDRQHYNLAFHKLSNNLVWVDGHVKGYITKSFAIDPVFFPYPYDRDSSLNTIYLMSGQSYITINAIGTVTVNNATDHKQRVGFFYMGKA